MKRRGGIMFDSMTRSPRAVCRRFAAVLTLGLAAACGADALALTCVSAQTGLWSAAATWSGCGGGNPGAGDDVVIQSPHVVTQSANDAALNLTINSGGTLTVTGVNLTVNAATNVAGTLNITSSTAGTKRFVGLVTIAGGAWNNSINEAVNFRGGLTFNGGTFAAGTGNQTFNTNAQSIGGTSAITIPNLIVNGVTLTNTGTLTASTTLSGSGGLTNGANATLNIGGTSTVTTFTASAAGNTVNYSGAAQTVRNPAGSAYHHLTLSGSAAKTMPAAALAMGGNFTLAGTATTAAAGNLTVTGNCVLGSGTSFDGSTFTHTIAGNFTNNGATFTPSTSTVSMTAIVAQTIGGTTGTTFHNLTINNPAGVSLSAVNATVSGALTFTAGNISTAANTVIMLAGATVSRTSGHVVGNLQKNVATGATARTFEIGDATTYAPINVTFASVIVAGNLIANTTAGDHPDTSAGTAGLDVNKSVNRYWTMTNSGITFTTYTATFNYAVGDNDGSSTPASYVVAKGDTCAGSGAARTCTTWALPTLITPGPSNMQATATGMTSFSDFAVGEKTASAAVPGSFNAFETATAASAITGVIKTKVAGSAFSLDVVAIAGGVQLVAFTGNVKIELLANTGTPGSGYGANNCPTANSVIQTIASAAIAGGRSTVNFPAVANVFQDVRVRISFPTISPTVTSCSTDSFAMRPNTFGNFSVSDTDWQTAGTTRALNDTTFGLIVHKAGRSFSVRADALNAASTPAITANYTGSPAASLTACAGAACTASFGALSLTTAFVAGQLVSDIATYSQVGSFTVQIVDSAFASIDSADGSTPAERNIQSAAIVAGRFVPDHFAMAKNTPVFGTACSGGTFSYVGQRFSYTTQPVITITAQDALNNTTTLYTGNWWRITNTSLTGKAYSALSGTLDTSGAPATDPVIAETVGSPGSGTLTFGSGTGFVFTRTTPAAPFNAEVGLSINVIDADAVAYAANPATVGAATTGNGIAFSAGKEMRFGRLRLQNANGSQLIAMPIPISAQYWNGSGFVTNTLDNCTTIAAGNVAIGNPQPAGFTVGAPTVGGAFNAGVGNLRLPASGAGTKGSVDVSVNLTGGTAGSSCTAGMPASTGANRTYLQGAWCGAGYTNDPTARATFGVYRNTDRFIYQRENY